MWDRITDFTDALLKGMRDFLPPRIVAGTYATLVMDHGYSTGIVEKFFHELVTNNTECLAVSQLYNKLDKSRNSNTSKMIDNTKMRNIIKCWGLFIKRKNSTDLSLRDNEKLEFI